MTPAEVQQLTCARIPTADGEFRLCLYVSNQDSKEHLALVLGDVADRSGVLARVHSECFTGDVLGSRRCDCGHQLEAAMRAIGAAPRGVIVYLRQEGRGIGLLDKLRAYNLQDEGYDTVDANLLLGHQVDERDYGVAAAILHDLRVRSVRLLTNNPHKIERLRDLGVAIDERLPLPATVTADNWQYLHTKAMRMQHMLPVSMPAENGAGAHYPHRHERT